MKRTLLIARREYVAYAKTVGFWLSLLAFPMFAVLGGGIPLLIRSAEPIKTVAVIEQGPAATGLAATVRDALQADLDRQGERLRIAAEKGQAGAGRAMASISAPKIRLVAAPAAIADATGPARDAAIKTALDKQTPKTDRLDAVVFLNRIDGKPAAQVWTARATDNDVSGFVRSALRDARRNELLAEAGVPPAVATEIQTFQPEVKAFSPNAASGAEVSMRDRIPSFVGLGAGFLLWSLVITGASILLNSVMEEKSNKILEVLLSSASTTEILTGKVLGVALLTLTVMAVWGGIGASTLMSASPQVAASIGQALMHDGLIFYFMAYMVGGYLMYAVLFAAIGAFCETPRDAQTLMGPIMMILVVPILVMQMALTSPDAPVVKVLSWIPFFTPFLMSARAPSDPPLIEVVLTLIGMFATAAFMVWIAGRAFRAGALSDVKLSWKTFGRAVTGQN
ncbi:MULTISPECIES: ABC transporter permease [unclassified Brevundimonas]|uniref:ABC transporter permease n=1 Tax=unclassified Brevundimonas TaxID=2622653 RepID=UPI0020059B5E|nr:MULTISPECIES: ABC transporter permease [unclassified Brevundimonas]MCK6104546.1 ABC transporter permease [Brevundimonas sp. EYE_349]